MIKKQVSRSHSMENGQHKQHNLSSARVFLLSGESISFFILLYLIISNGANEALHLWIPFVMLGIALFITSRVIH
jgi:hypothetical protein